jgi:hypothetical protein
MNGHALVRVVLQLGNGFLRHERTTPRDSQPRWARNFAVFCAAALLGLLPCAVPSAHSQDQTDRPGPLSLQAVPESGGSPAAAGYATPRWEVGTGYQYNYIDIRGAFSPFSTNGFNISGTRYFGRVLGIEADTGFGFGHAAPGVSARSIFVGGGPHIAYRTHSRFEPWVHGLLGVENFHFGGTSFPGNTTSFALQGGGGLDYHFDRGLVVRVQGDYLGTHLGGVYQRNFQIVGGLVWSF